MATQLKPQVSVSGCSHKQVFLAINVRLLNLPSATHLYDVSERLTSFRGIIHGKRLDLRADAGNFGSYSIFIMDLLLSPQSTSAKA